MAILSKKIDFANGIWVEIGSAGFVGQKDHSGAVVIEIVNAGALPVGDVPEAQVVSTAANLSFPAPLAGKLYARAKSGVGTLKYYEV